VCDLVSLCGERFGRVSGFFVCVGWVFDYCVGV